MRNFVYIYVYFNGETLGEALREALRATLHKIYANRVPTKKDLPLLFC